MDKIRNRIVLFSLRLFENKIKIPDIQKIMTILFPEQNKINTEFLIEQSLEIYDSLNKAINKAGGTGWDGDALSKITVLELITALGVNKIRFCFNEKNFNNIELFILQQKKEFKRQLKNDPNNTLAAFAIDIYDEIIKEKK